jgi:hypothetical protein
MSMNIPDAERGPGPGPESDSVDDFVRVLGPLESMSLLESTIKTSNQHMIHDLFSGLLQSRDEEGILTRGSFV